jgi:hypothetical protein
MAEPEDITPSSDDFEVESDGLPDFSVRQSIEAPSGRFSNTAAQEAWDALEESEPNGEQQPPEPAQQPRPGRLAGALAGLGDAEPDGGEAI